MATNRRAVLVGMGVLACALMGGCATSAAAHPDQNHYRIPYSHKGIGVGSEPNPYHVVLDEGKEVAAVRRAIEEAFSKRAASSKFPSDGVAESDIVPLSSEAVKNYNDTVEPQFRLHNDRQYGVAYRVAYGTGGDIDLNIAAILQNRGANNPWRPASFRDYDSRYFTAPLFDDIKASLLKNSARGLEAAP